jgi:ACS family hexuronate transporter-like MFS transporter
MPQAKATAARIGNYRWGIIVLLFAAIAINYTHRQMLGLFKPTLEKDLGWNEEGYGLMVFWFQVAYALGQFGFGRFLDLAGVRIGYTIAYAIWVCAHMATGVVTSPAQFTMARFALGLGESGSFPSSLKAISEWFPQKERALAAGIFNSGTSIGVVLAAAGVPFIALGEFHINGINATLHGLNWGWRGSFIFTGALSLLWLIPWLAMYRRPAQHKKIGAAELEHIQKDPVEALTETVSFWKVVAKKETWVYALMKFMIDPIWWLYLFWLPDFFKKTYGLDVGSFGPPLVAIYLLADVGSVLGGWMSSAMIKRGVSVNLSRKSTYFLFALFAVPMFFVHTIHDLWPAVLMIGLATAAHQAFSCNVYTFPSDIFPRQAVGTVLGIGGAAGAVGGMVMSLVVAWILQSAKDAGHPASGYTVIFAIAAFTYLTTFLVVHLLSPKYKRVQGL